MTIDEQVDAIDEARASPATFRDAVEDILVFARQQALADVDESVEAVVCWLRGDSPRINTKHLRNLLNVVAVLRKGAV